MVKRDLDRIKWSSDFEIECLTTWGTNPLRALVDSIDNTYVLDNRLFFLLEAIKEHTADFHACIMRLMAERQQMESEVADV